MCQWLEQRGEVNLAWSKLPQARDLVVRCTYRYLSDPHSGPTQTNHIFASRA